MTRRIKLNQQKPKNNNNIVIVYNNQRCYHSVARSRTTTAAAAATVFVTKSRIVQHTVAGIVLCCCLFSSNYNTFCSSFAIIPQQQHQKHYHSSSSSSSLHLLVGRTRQSLKTTRITKTRSFHINRQQTLLFMVRNIDLPEALILYGSDVCLDEQSQSTIRSFSTNTRTGTQPSLLLRKGLLGLIQECIDIDSVVIVLIEQQQQQQQPTSNNNNHNNHSTLIDVNESNNTENIVNQDVTTNDDDDIMVSMLSKLLPQQCKIYKQTVQPPNPYDLLYSIQSVTIQPRGFGGSSGFGRKNADPERSPEPKYTVVIGTTIDHSRAARMAGMRIISLNKHDPLADAVILDDDIVIDFGVDDIATPGSFWLNPPHPRDDDSNRVDPYEMIDYYNTNKNLDSNTNNIANELDDDDEIDYDAILADLAKL